MFTRANPADQVTVKLHESDHRHRPGHWTVFSKSIVCACCSILRRSQALGRADGIQADGWTDGIYGKHKKHASLFALRELSADSHNIKAEVGA